MICTGTFSLTINLVLFFNLYFFLTIHFQIIVLLLTFSCFYLWALEIGQYPAALSTFVLDIHESGVKNEKKFSRQISFFPILLINTIYFQTISLFLLNFSSSIFIIVCGQFIFTGKTIFFYLSFLEVLYILYNFWTIFLFNI